mgnify:CR=1 FL=1
MQNRRHQEYNKENSSPVRIWKPDGKKSYRKGLDGNMILLILSIIMFCVILITELLKRTK